MLTSIQVKKAIEKYFDTWNSGNRQEWIACWAKDTILEDPVGGPKKGGIQSIEETWDRTIKTGGDWKLEPVLVRISGNEAGLHIKNINTRDNYVNESIEFWRFNDDCKINSCRTFFTKDGVLDSFFIGENVIAG